jgi:hypothetical protein
MDPPGSLGHCSAGIEHLDSILAPVGGGKMEGKLFVVRIEHNQKAVLSRASRLAFCAYRRAAVKEDLKRLGEARPPVVFRHLAAVRLEPSDIRNLISGRTSLPQPIASTQDRMTLAQVNQLTSEFRRWWWVRSAYRCSSSSKRRQESY